MSDGSHNAISIDDGEVFPATSSMAQDDDIETDDAVVAAVCISRVIIPERCLSIRIMETRSLASGAAYQVRVLSCRVSISCTMTRIKPKS